MSANNSNNSSVSHAGPRSQPTPKHQVFNPAAPAPTDLSQLSPQSSGTESTHDFAAQPFAGLEDPFLGIEGGAGRWRENDSGHLAPRYPAVPTPSENENSDPMRAFIQEMIETRRERKDWNERVEVERGREFRLRPGGAARERPRRRADRRRERMGILEEAVVERVDEAIAVNKRKKEEVVQEPKRKKIRLSGDDLIDGEKRGG